MINNWVRLSELRIWTNVLHQYYIHALVKLTERKPSTATCRLASVVIWRENNVIKVDDAENQVELWIWE
jgi:hypothetical protein